MFKTTSRLFSLALFALLGCADLDRSTPDEPSGSLDAPVEGLPLEGSLDAGSRGVRNAKIRVGRYTFDVLLAGPITGTPVILLHGFPQNASVWTSQIGALAQAGYHVIAPNQRGYSDGARPTAVEAYAEHALVEDVVGLANALLLPRFHLVGHDWGAGVAWATAAAVPHRILTLTAISVPHPDAFSRVLADPSSCQPKASSYFALFTQPAPAAEDRLRASDAAYLRAVYGDLPKPLVDAYVAYFQGPALTGGLNWYRANVANGNFTSPKIGPIATPTLYVWSDGDSAICRDGAELTREYVTGPYRFEVLTGVSHWVPELAAERVNALLLEHFRTRGRGPSNPDAGH